jgi:site-specific DNA recombinase
VSEQATVSPEQEEAAETAVVYLRVSSAGQVNRGSDPEGYSIPGQREATKARAGSLQAELIGEFVEYGVSGRTTHRPALQRMLAELPKLRPTYVIVYDLSRLARNRLDDALLMLKIEQSGARLVSVLENIDQTPSGRLTHGVMAAVNEFRSAGDAEKVKMGLHRKHTLGGTNGKAPVGYLNVRGRVLGRDVRTVELDADRAPLVRMGFETYATGEYSISAITDLLDVAGLRLPMSAKRPARPLARSAVHRMLCDDYYIGVVTYAGSKNPDGEHPPLIDTETFERVQAVLQAHALSGDRSRKYEHYLKGSIYCGVCGSRLLFMHIKGNGGVYDYFGCQGRRRRGVTCYGPYVPVDDVERAIERYYGRHVGLSPAAQDRIRARVHHYAEQKLQAARREAERASRRLDALKQEQQRLLQLSYQDLVDTDVLAAEQARIKAERAQLAKWAKVVAHDEQDIKTALDEALRLLDKPGAAYQRATPTIRRMLNQAIFEQLHILDGEVIQAAPTPLVQALESLARPQRRPRRPQAAGKSLRTAIRAEQEARNDRDLLNGGHGLHNDQMVRPSGLEPPRTKRSTRPSTLRVYQFRHRRRGGEYSRLPASRRLALASVHGPRYCTNTCSFHGPIHTTREPRTHGSDQASAGDLRLHPQVLGQVRLPAHGARHRQGGWLGVVFDRSRPSRQPREDRPSAPRPV